MPAQRQLPPDLGDSPFTLERARMLGITARMLRGRRFRRLHRGVYVRAHVALDVGVRVNAAKLVAPSDAVPTGVTALALFDAPVGVDRRIHLVSTSPGQHRIKDVVVHRREHPPPLCEFRGRILTTPEHAWVEAARRLGFVDLIVAAERLLYLGRVTRQELEAYLRYSHDHGVRRARRVFTYVRERVESPRETVVRLMLVFARLPEPVTNRSMRLPTGRTVRPDLTYVEWRVVVEYDGAYHLQRPDGTVDWRQHTRDLERREALEAAGWRVVVITGHAMRDPQAVVCRIHAALEEQGYPGPPPRFNDIWKRWFAPETPDS
jgi:hypothetical protein